MPPAPRIVSLLPSATEIVCALGFQAALVGRSHECDYPAGVAALPVCTAPRIHPAGSGAEIHREVTALLQTAQLQPGMLQGAQLQDALSLYELHLEVLRRLAPDLIVTQAQCDVCAVSLEQVERGVRQVLAEGRSAAGREPRLVSLEPTNLAAVWTDVARVAEALAVPERGKALVHDLKRRMAAVAARAAGLKPRPRVALLEWLDPPMAAGNWMPELLRLAAGETPFSKAGEPSPWLDWDALLQADPDVLLVMPCGFGLDKTRAESRGLTGRPGWAQLKAVRTGRVALADGHQFFNRPGPRLAESLEILVEVLHPATFDFGHRGQAWAWMEP